MWLRYRMLLSSFADWEVWYVNEQYTPSRAARTRVPSRASHGTSAAGEEACYMAAPRNAWGGSVFALASDHSQDG